jgi:hypothetical protein
MVMSVEEIEGAAKANHRLVSISFFGPATEGAHWGMVDVAREPLRSSGTAFRSARKRKRFRYTARTILG